jgi:hypothetical protein
MSTQWGGEMRWFICMVAWYGDFGWMG